MTGIWCRFVARRDGWIVRPPRWVERTEAAIRVAIAILAIYPLVYLPPLFLLVVMKYAHVTGTGVDSVATFDGVWKLAMVAAAAFMIAGSAVIGGYARMAFDMVGNRCALLILTGGFGGLFAYIGNFSRAASGSLDLSKGDHGLIAAILVIWLFTVGYVCKVPWDRARDVWSRHFTAGRLRTTRRLRDAAKNRMRRRSDEPDR